MVATVVRLKLRLWLNGLRRSPWQVVGLLVAVLYTAGAVVLALGGFVAVGTRDEELRTSVPVLAGSLLVLGWWVVPLLAFGVDATVDPARFAVFPVPRRTLLVGLGLAALVGVPGLATTVVGLGTALVWWRVPAAALAGVLGGALGVAVCVVGSRALTTALAPVLSARRYRELAATVVLLPVLLVPLARLSPGHPMLEARVLPGVARVLGWTPWGAPWAVGADVAAGRWGAGAAHLAVGLAGLAGAALGWDRALAATVARPPRVGTARVRWGGDGLFARFPSTPTGAVAARSLTYWARDPRYATTLVAAPLAGVALLTLTGGGPAPLALGPLAAFLLGWTVAAGISYDGTAFWAHLAAPLHGRQDRWGRAWAGAVVGAPLCVGLALASLAATGRWDATAPIVGLTLGVLATTLGVSSVASAWVVQPVAPPGASPLAAPQGSTTAGMATQAVGWLCLAVLVSPSLVLTVLAVSSRSPVLGAVAAVVGVALGGALLVAGVRVGGGVYDRRAPELMTSLTSLG